MGVRATAPSDLCSEHRVGARTGAAKWAARVGVVRGRVRISVTADDIQNGYRESNVECPIARAVRRQVLPSEPAPPLFMRRYLVVEPKVVYLWEATKKTDWRRSTLPLSRRAQRFVAAFDAGRPVKPFRFMLEVPE